MIFYPNQDIKGFRAPWYDRIHPAVFALLVWLAFMLFQSIEWWLR